MAENPQKRNEDEYFNREDAELIKRMRAKLDAERQAAERAKSAMKCPRCGGTLAEVTQNNVTIDRCGSCQGVWLDAGELELIARAAQSSGPGFVDNLLGFFRAK
jgi:hypothetical protein